MFGVTQPDGTEVQESIYSMSKSIYIIVLVYRVTFRDSELLRPGLCPEGETQIKWSKKAAQDEHRYRNSVGFRETGKSLT